MTSITIRFDHSKLARKPVCINFLREFGVRSDWARRKLEDMQNMLRNYSDEKMFRAAEKIAMRDGEKFFRSDFEVETNDSENMGCIRNHMSQATHPATELGFLSKPERKMKYVFSIECDNAAFEGAPLLAIAAMLEAQAEKMKRWGDSRRWSDCVLDANGKGVGRSELCEARHD